MHSELVTNDIFSQTSPQPILHEQESIFFFKKKTNAEGWDASGMLELLRFDLEYCVATFFLVC